MGVQGLLQLLKSAQEDVHISKMRGKTAVIDIMVWLYKGAFSCSYELATEQQTLAFLSYPLKMLKMMINYEVKPICVFDGMKLGAKSDTEKNRMENKKKNKKMGVEMAGNGEDGEARKYFGRSLVLRSKMIDLFIDILQCLEIEYVMAPYEADAQMSYMVKMGLADFAVTEDSDLIVYGCPDIALKLGLNGYMKRFCYQQFKENKEVKNSKDKHLVTLQKLSRLQLVQACIMAGCEYLPSIPSIGLKVALKHIDTHKDIDAVIEHLRKSKTFREKVPEDYAERLKQVQQLFFYQTVYDPRRKCLDSLSVLPQKEDIDREYLGVHIDKKLLDKYVKGLLDRRTMERRESHAKVLDLRRLLDDWQTNSIHERSFICLDFAFFEKEKPREKSGGEEGKEEKEGSDEGQSILDMIKHLKEQKRKEVILDAEDLGFCLEEDEEEEEDNEEEDKEEEKEEEEEEKDENNIPEQQITAQEFVEQEGELDVTVSEDGLDQLVAEIEENNAKAKVVTNKIVKKDLEILSSLCSQQNKQLNQKADEELKELSNEHSLPPKQVEEKAVEEIISTPFSKFSKVVTLNDDVQTSQKPPKFGVKKSGKKSEEKSVEKSEPKRTNKKRKIGEISKGEKPNGKLDFFFQGDIKKRKLNGKPQ